MTASAAAPLTPSVGAVERVTIDASVWLAALWAHEPGYAAAAQVLAEIDRQQIRMVQPMLFLPEVCGAVRRRTGREDMAAALTDVLLRSPLMTMSPLTLDVATESAACAVRLGLRGADACYVATSRLEQTTLITLDIEVIERARVLAHVWSPSEWLRR
ncbi:type II toxin-antitoxin system VapC family toxin [Gemmatimonas sp.]|uniref:type II toxin-antitoxin system VapC family toxin n=1 Tax=Gemmatimonas sp. TaxID=1962908 RepID=UPI003DA51821